MSSNKSLQLAAVGLFFAVGLAGLFIIGQALNEKNRSDKGYPLSAVFDDARQIEIGKPVRVAGVQVGKVQSISLEGGRARVDIRVDDNVQLPEDSVASVGMGSVLGGNYIEVRYGKSATMLGRDGRLRTEASTDITTVLTRVSDFVTSAEGLINDNKGKIDTFLTNANSLLEENRTKVGNLITNLEEVSVKLNKGEGTLGKLINDASIHKELEGAIGDVRTAIADIKSASASAKEGFGDLQEVASKIRKGEGTLGQLVMDDKIGKDIEAAIANFKGFSEKFNNENGTLQKLLSDDSIYKDAKMLMGKAERAMDAVSDTGPVSAVGAAAGALF